MAYEAKDIQAKDVETLRRVIEEEFRNVAAGVAEQDFLAMRVLFAEPTKRFRGLVVYADGTSWNPGSGEGVYRHNGSAWVFLG